jgi:cell division protein FtsN
LVVIFMGGYLLGRHQVRVPRIDLSDLTDLQALQVETASVGADEAEGSPFLMPEEEASAEAEEAAGGAGVAEEGGKLAASQTPGGSDGTALGDVNNVAQNGTFARVGEARENPGAKVVQEQAKEDVSASSDVDPVVEKKGFALQVAAFGSKANAERFSANMQEKGYSQVFVFEDQGSRLTYAVRLGFFESYADALKAADAFKKAENRSPMVVNRTLTGSRTI